MYQIKKIQDSLMHLVGWEQSINPSKEIDSNLTKTESGLYFQNAHPLMTLENVESIMPDDWNLQYPIWSNDKAYSIGEKVKNLNIIYIALNDNVGSEPSPTNNDWKIYNMLSDYLYRQTRNGIATMIQNFVQIKQLNEETKTLFDRNTLFDGFGRKSATEKNKGNLVGFELTPIKSMGVTTKIEKIGLQMTGGIGTVKMYLFHSSKIDPINTFDLDFNLTNGGFQWFDLDDCYLPYISNEINSGGRWFLVYNQDDLPVGMQAITIQKDWSAQPCGGCNKGDLTLWNELTKYVKISPFKVKALTTFKQYPELWDLYKMIYTTTVNYGLNLELTVGCDLTDFIISQRNIFKTVLQKQTAVILLRTMAMNPDVRVNRNQSNVSRMDILYELDGNTNGTYKNGLGWELEKAYKALNLDTKGLDRLCLSCNNGGVRYRSI